MTDLTSMIEGLIGDARADIELAIFGTSDPASIGAAVDRFCRRHLGQRIESYTFYRSSVASVHGVQLADGRRVVVKAHQPDVAKAHLEAVTTMQCRMADDGFPCPRPVLDPVPFGNGMVTVEEELTRGGWHDGHDPRFRRGMARSLAELVERCRSLEEETRSLQLDRFLALLPDRLWPVPHAVMFDFEATTAGAEAIDAIAASARSVLDDVRIHRTVAGHTDWRAENLRFDGEDVSAVYDWQSLVRTSEPVLVGGVAHAFCSDWSTPPSGTQAPTLDEVRAFVSEFEEARGAAFGRDDRRLIGAGYAYATAYTARCGHASILQRRRRRTRGSEPSSENMASRCSTCEGA